MIKSKKNQRPPRFGKLRDRAPKNAGSIKVANRPPSAGGHAGARAGERQMAALQRQRKQGDAHQRQRPGRMRAEEIPGGSVWSRENDRGGKSSKKNRTVQYAGKELAKVARAVPKRKQKSTGIRRDEQGGHVKSRRAPG